VNLVSFIYTNARNETRKRFVAVSSRNSFYLNGTDLQDGSFKTFSLANMDGITALGDYDGGVLVASRVISKNDVFTLLKWDVDSINVFNSLGANPYSLANLVTKVTNRSIIALDDEYFIVMGKEVMITVSNGSVKLNMRVSENSIEYYDGNKKLTTSEFTKRILGA
jgi:hypothetical protein